MKKKYRVVFLGLISPKNEFKKKMSGFGVSSEQIEHILKAAPIILKDGMPLGYAREYADAVQLAGGRVNIQEYGIFDEGDGTQRSIEILSLENFFMCPECGHKQPKGMTCVKCGLVYQERENISGYKNE